MVGFNYNEFAAISGAVSKTTMRPTAGLLTPLDSALTKANFVQADELRGCSNYAQPPVVIAAILDCLVQAGMVTVDEVQNFTKKGNLVGLESKFESYFLSFTEQMRNELMSQVVAGKNSILVESTRLLTGKFDKGNAAGNVKHWTPTIHNGEWTINCGAATGKIATVSVLSDDYALTPFELSEKAQEYPELVFFAKKLIRVLASNMSPLGHAYVLDSAGDVAGLSNCDCSEARWMQDSDEYKVFGEHAFERALFDTMQSNLEFSEVMSFEDVFNTDELSEDDADAVESFHASVALYQAEGRVFFKDALIEEGLSNLTIPQWEAHIESVVSKFAKKDVAGVAETIKALIAQFCEIEEKVNAIVSPFFNSEEHQVQMEYLSECFSCNGESTHFLTLFRADASVKHPETLMTIDSTMARACRDQMNSGASSSAQYTTLPVSFGSFTEDDELDASLVYSSFSILSALPELFRLINEMAWLVRQIFAQLDEALAQ
jgi:hypothetical protein